jgi:hypothetical protein
MNTTHAAATATAQHRWIHGTNPWQGASMVLNSVLPASPAATTNRSRIKAGASLSDAGFDAAIARYEHGEWEPAYQMLAQLADDGHALALKLALLMLRYGAPLYGTRFVATPKQVAHWARQVLAASKWN